MHLDAKTSSLIASKLLLMLLTLQDKSLNLLFLFGRSVLIKYLCVGVGEEEKDRLERNGRRDRDMASLTTGMWPEVTREITAHYYGYKNTINRVSSHLSQNFQLKVSMRVNLWQ